MRILQSFLWVSVVLVLTSLPWVNVWAQAPNSISYSGQLTTPQGDPRDGTFNMTFRIYDAPAGGTELHRQAINNVVVRRGQFSVLLSGFTDNVFLQGSGGRYVEVQVGAESPVLPRQRLISVPFAQRAGSIDGAKGGTITNGLFVNSTNGIGLNGSALRIRNVLDGAVSGQDLAGVYVIGPSLSSGATVRNAFGVYISSQRVAGVQGGIGVYQDGAADSNFFAGNVSIKGGPPREALHVYGNSIVTGTKSALVETASFGQRRLYAMESPGNWFEDFGSAQLQDGETTVQMDEIFVQTVNTNLRYHVFLTPNGNCSLYVERKTPRAFKVVLRGGEPDCEFDYRIIAKRKGYEQVRLEELKSSESK